MDAPGDVQIITEQNDSLTYRENENKSFVVQLFEDGSYCFIRGNQDSKREPHTEASIAFLRELQGDSAPAQKLPEPSKVPAAVPVPYLRRLLGKGMAPAPAVPAHHIAWAWLGSFCGIISLLSISNALYAETEELIFIQGSFGAQAVLVFAAVGAPLAQPWNCVCGNFVSALIGVSAWKAVGSEDTLGQPELAGALAVSFSVVGMLLLRCLHPPGGATALIACLGSPKMVSLGYLYVFFPAVLASILQVGMGVFINNISRDPKRQYPQNWRFY